MGKCSKCGDEILYNKYKLINGKVFCPNCEKIKNQVKKLATPNCEAIEALKEFDITFLNKCPNCKGKCACGGNDGLQ